MTLETQHGQFYSDQEVMGEAKSTNANYLIFSDGGYRSSIPCSVGAFVVYAILEDRARPIAAQGFLLNGYPGSFPG